MLSELDLSAKPQPFLVKPNGGWCWFHCERAVAVGPRIVFGSVAGRSRSGSDAGDAELTAFHVDAHRGEGVTLWSPKIVDDHVVPAILTLGDGTLLVSYQAHSDPGPSGQLVRWRKVAGLDPLTVTAEWRCDAGASVCYSNLCRIAAENDRIYSFHRGRNWNPNYLISDDGGTSFRYGGQLLHWPRPSSENPKFSGHDGGRPYIVYRANGADIIHIVASEDHPRAYDNSLYHGMFRNGKLLSSHGVEIGTTSPEPCPRPDRLTSIYVGTSDSIAWPIELRLDQEGRPIALFSVRKGDHKQRRHPGVGGKDHRYMIARFNDVNWSTQELCYAGSRLYPGEEDYTGLCSLDPEDTRIIVVSSDVAPENGTQVAGPVRGRRFELFLGMTDRDGGNFRYIPLTANSSADNIRPYIVSIDSRRSLVLWMRGEYRSYSDYDTDIFGAIFDREWLARLFGFEAAPNARHKIVKASG
jgi:putative BNR repeat neuraminidase